MAADVTIFAALFAGLLSFLSPCVLPLVPPYLVYLAGTSLERFADAEPELRVRWDTVGAAALFVAGFSTVFVALGATAAQAIIGREFRITEDRGRIVRALEDGPPVLAKDRQVDPGEAGMIAGAPDHVGDVEDAVILEQRTAVPHAHHAGYGSIPAAIRSSGLTRTNGAACPSNLGRSLRPR